MPSKEFTNDELFEEITVIRGKNAKVLNQSKNMRDGNYTIKEKNKHCDEQSKMSKLDNETEVLNHKTVDKSICKLIQQARLQKGMKQKDLANKLNIQVTVIQNIESGKSIEDKALINRIARTLGIQLKKK